MSPDDFEHGGDQGSQLPQVLRLQTRADVIWELRRMGPGPARDSVLEILEASAAALIQVKTFAQARRLSSVAEALRACTEELGLAKEIQDDAAAFAIRAEYRANELLAAARKRGELATGSRGQLRGRTSTGEPNVYKKSLESGMPQSTPPDKTTLAEAGIDKNFAKRIRRWGKFNPEDLEARIEEKRAEGKLTKTAILSDPKPKKEPEAARYFVALFEDLQRKPDAYDAGAFAANQKIVALYRAVQPKFLSFLRAFDAKTKADPATGHM